MKTVTLFEENDKVKIINGRDKGKLGVVQYDQESDDSQVDVILQENLSIDEDGEERGDYNSYYVPKQLKIISEKEYNTAKKDLPFLRVKSCEEALKVVNKELVVGCQRISFADAKLIANFITKHCVSKKKK